MNTDDLKDWLVRVEGKLDDALKEVATSRADIAWLKRGLGAAFVLLTGVLGKVIQTTFFK